jgi:hypothetical protein
MVSSSFGATGDIRICLVNAEGQEGHGAKGFAATIIQLVLEIRSESF